MHYLLNKQLAQVKITAHFEVTFKQFFENLNTVVFFHEIDILLSPECILNTGLVDFGEED